MLACSFPIAVFYRLEVERIVELVPEQSEANILLYSMSAGRKETQTFFKPGFGVEDVEVFCRKAKERGLPFGAKRVAERRWCFAELCRCARNAALQHECLKDNQQVEVNLV